jgi:hypothetical protein
MRAFILKSTFASLGLLGLLACGGSSSSSSPSGPTTTLAKGLGYTDPTGSGWRLVKDASSTGTHLVLDLMGPADSKSRGVGFNLEGGGQVTFGRFVDGTYLQDGGVYELFNSTAAVPGSPDDTPLLNGGVKGTLLTVGIFQKDRRLEPKAHAKALLRIAVDFDPATTGTLTAGTPVPLTVTKARIVPEDIGGISDASEIKAKSQMETITIALGTLTAE